MKDSGIDIKTNSSGENFEPKIIGFLCNWSAYASADLCGTFRKQHGTNIRSIRIMCTSRVDPTIVLEMFINGADGIFIAGCHPGNCHYLTGNYLAEKKIKLTKKLLDKSGIHPDRISLEWISASETEKYILTLDSFVNRIRELGPIPTSGDNPDIEILEKLYAAIHVANDFRLRSLVGREYELIKEGNVYHQEVVEEDFESLIDTAIEEEMARQRILQTILDNPSSVIDISNTIDLPTQIVLGHIVTLRDRGLVALDRIEDDMPLYIVTQPEEVFR